MLQVILATACSAICSALNKGDMPISTSAAILQVTPSRYVNTCLVGQNRSPTGVKIGSLMLRTGNEQVRTERLYSGSRLITHTDRF